VDVVLFLVVSGALAILDLSLKRAVVSRIKAGTSPPQPGEGPPIGIFPVTNPRGGLAELSPPAGALGLLVLAGLCIGLIVISDDATWLAVGLGLAWGGALANWLDAVRHGEVVDYLRLRSGLTANLADISIALGTVVAVISFVRAPW
jgi:lipoprotein signal peptidase